jgi:hypothetical protein
MVEVVGTDEFKAWYEDLSSAQMDAIDYVVELLGALGVLLKFPHSSGLNDTNPKFRELRTTAGDSELRIVYAFDPRRDAVLIIGGDKGGDDRFYSWILPQAEKIWDQYLTEQDFEKPEKE